MKFALTNKSEYFHFHKRHNHTTNYYIQLNMKLKSWKKGKLTEYTKDGKKDRENSPKRKQSLKKFIEVMVKAKGKDVSSWEDRGNKGKR